MGIASGLVVYLVIWWVIIFAVLPWGIKREISPQPGHDPGAPVKTYLGQKFAITSVISALLWGLVYYIIENGLISFDN